MDAILTQPLAQTSAQARVGRIARLVLNVRDMAAVRAFYVDALGFTPAPETADGEVRLRLGGQEIALAPASPGAAPYPEPRAANDPWFQHFAIAVGDIAAAYARLQRFGAEPISIGGPQRLPASTGSVTAYKFRDPEGRPLELSHTPGGAWATVAKAAPSAVFLGVDHVAFTASDLGRSLTFYQGLGFVQIARGLNQGAEQARLDGLDDAVVDILVLTPPEPGPHVELLHYRTPAPAAPRPVSFGDLAATLTVLAPPKGQAAQDEADGLLDPNGHWLRIS